MNYSRLVAKGFLSLFLGFIMGVALSYVIRIIIARNLSTYDYGLFSAVFTFVAFFLFFRNFGIGTALVKFIPDFLVKKAKHKVKSAIVFSLWLQLIIIVVYAILLFSLSDYLSVHYFKDALASNLLKWMILYVAFGAISQLLSSIFQSLKETKIMSLFEPIKNAMILFALVFLGLKFSVNGVIHAYILGWIAVFIYLAFFFIKKTNKLNIWKCKLVEKVKFYKVLMGFGIAFIFTNIADRTIGYFDVLVLTYYRPLEEVGIYSIILPSSMVFLYFASAIGGIIYPVTSELWAKKDMARLSELIRLVYKYLFFILAPPVMAIFVFPDFFVSTFFGANYLGGRIPFQILLFGIILFSLARINILLLAGIGKPKKVFFATLGSGISSLIFSLLLIPTYGILGAAIATVISYILILIVTIIMLKKYINFKVPVIPWIKTVIIGGVFIFIVNVIKNVLVSNVYVEIVVSLVCASAVYLGAGHVLKIINISEIKKYVKIIRKNE